MDGQCSWVDGKEETTGGILLKIVFLKIPQNSQKNACSRVSFAIEVKAEVCNFIKKERLKHRCFTVNFTKFLKTIFYRTSLDYCSLVDGGKPRLNYTRNYRRI